jgi:hypothetical protein
MTVLSACALAAIELNQPEPASLFSTTDKLAQELRTQANKSASAILKVYDWQRQLAVHTLTGDGTTTSFALPSDYDRMPLKAMVMSSSFSWGLRPARDLDEWLDFQIRPFNGSPGAWIILGGAMQVLPAIDTGVTAKFYYVKNTVVTSAASAAQTGFLADADTFNLSERLLTLDIVWRWRAQKRMEYSEDMRNFEIALSEEIAKDRGPRILTVGRQRFGLDATPAYPGTLGP